VERMKGFIFALIEGLRQIFLDFWLVKIVVTALAAAWLDNALLIVLIALLVVMDTVSKQLALVSGYVSERQGKPLVEVTKREIFRNFFRAIQPQFISSRGFRGIFLKICLYGSLILIALFLEQSPPKVIFGINALKTLADGIFVAIVCTEMYSILENFRDMGSPAVEKLQGFVETLWERLGGRWSGSIRIDKKEGGGR